VDADEFVNALVDLYGTLLDGQFDGGFFLYGHSAGGQFAARYTVTHPERLKGAVLSAPGRYAFPKPGVAWPNGMASMIRDEALSGSPATGKDPLRSGGALYQPSARAWTFAAANVPIAIVIGSEDTETRPPAPGHKSGTRIEYATEWAEAMNQLSADYGSSQRVDLFMVDGVAHDPIALTPKAWTILLGWMD
jgi:pimeloyl-ACP methyl ester carboxylesterase